MFVVPVNPGYAVPINTFIFEHDFLFCSPDTAHHS